MSKTSSSKIVSRSNQTDSSTHTWYFNNSFKGVYLLYPNYIPMRKQGINWTFLGRTKHQRLSKSGSVSSNYRRQEYDALRKTPSRCRPYTRQTVIKLSAFDSRTLMAWLLPFPSKAPTTSVHHLRLLFAGSFDSENASCNEGLNTQFFSTSSGCLDQWSLQLNWHTLFKWN